MQLLPPSAMLGISGGRAFRPGVRRHDRRHAPYAAGQICGGRLYRARGLYGRAVRLAELGHARSRRSANWWRSSRPEVCWPSTFAYVATQVLVDALFSGGRCAPAVSFLAGRPVRRTFLALDYRPVSQGGSVCRGKLHGAGAAQSAGAAGQRVSCPIAWPWRNGA